MCFFGLIDMFRNIVIINPCFSLIVMLSGEWVAIYNPTYVYNFCFILFFTDKYSCPVVDESNLPEDAIPPIGDIPIADVNKILYSWW